MRIMCTINNKKKYEINKGMAIKTGDDTMYRKQKALDFCQQMRKQERCRTVVWKFHRESHKKNSKVNIWLYEIDNFLSFTIVIFSHNRAIF